ncbi:MAG: ATP-binding protein [Cytophagaceae bacterium]
MSITPETEISYFDFIPGNGEMAERTRNFDWSKTTLGIADRWPQSLRTILNVIISSRFPMFLWWGPELLCFYNDAYRPSLGNDGKHPAALGKPAEEVWPEIWHIIKPLIDHVLSTGEATWSEDQLVPIYRNGSIEDVYWTFSYSPVSDESSTRTGVLVTCTETTQKVILINQLKESEERFRTMAEGSEILIATSDETGNADYFNKGWIELTGRSMNNLLDFGWVDLIHAEDREMYVKICLKAFEKKVPFAGEFRILNREGNYRWLLAKGPPRFRPDGSFAGYISSCVDITEQKEAEKTLRSSNEQLLRTNNDLDNFIYTASHDLKAPMSNIEGLLTSLHDSLLCNKEKINDETEMIIQLMEKSILRFKNTIQDLTDISKAQKEMEEDVHEIIMSQIVEDVKLSINDKILLSGAVIRADFSEVNMLRFSKKNFTSIVYNLLSNAIKYADNCRSSEIDIKTSRSEEFVLLSIKDNGLGINEQNKRKMFTMFKRFHDHVEGTGIGLYIVKRIVDNAGGKIEVESKLGEGTTFNVFFKAE